MHDSHAPPLRAQPCSWPIRIAVACALALFYCTGYLLVERHPPRPPIEFALTPIDRWIRFSPRWVGAYQSVYFLLPAALLATTRDQVRRFAIGFTAFTLVGFSCFILWPVRGPRPAITPSSGMFGLLTRVDLPLNTFPSMHMAVATYCACVAIQLSRGRCRRILLVALPIWVLLIGYAALATKQHYLVDLPAGILLGWVAQFLAWRTARRDQDCRQRSIRGM